jgi:hypothetical protein
VRLRVNDTKEVVSKKGDSRREEHVREDVGK